MNSTFEVIRSYLDNKKEIIAYENGRRVLDIILDDYNVDGACKVLQALGYYMLYRDY